MPDVYFNDSDHGSPTDCQVFIALTGSAQYVRSQLERIVREMNLRSAKPLQGQTEEPDGCRQVKTPIWNGERYCE